MAITIGNSKRDLITKAKSSQFVIIIIASVIISASLIGIKILWEQRSYQSEIIDAKTTARDQLEKNIQAVEQLKVEFVALEKSDVNSSLVLDALPSKYDFPALATTMEKISITSAVDLDSFVGTDATATAQNSSGAPQPVEIPFSITISGKYDDIQKFVTNLQRSIRPFKIDSISIESSEAGIKSDMQITTYYQPAKSIEIKKINISSNSSTTESAAGEIAPGQLAPVPGSNTGAAGAAQ